MEIESETESAQSQNAFVNIIKLYAKMLTKIVDLYSVKTVDTIGTMLGLDVDGKQISQQTTYELLIGLNGLYNKISDPAVQQKLIELIKELSPVLQEAAGAMMGILFNLLSLMVKQGINIMCAIPPINIMCSASNMMSAAAKFGTSVFENSEKLKGSYDKTIEKLNNFLGDANKIPSFSEGYKKGINYVTNNPRYQQLMSQGQNMLSKAKDLYTNRNEILSKGKNVVENIKTEGQKVATQVYNQIPVTGKALNFGMNALNKATNVAKNVTKSVAKPIQQGGAARRSRKKIIKRLRKSIKKFLTG